MSEMVGSKSRVKSLILHIISISVASLIVIPILFGVLGGFKHNGQLASDPIGLPHPWTLDNYSMILGSSKFWQPLMMSLIIGVATVVVVVALGAAAAYTFARFAFRGREFFFTIFGIGLMFPFAV